MKEYLEQRTVNTHYFFGIRHKTQINTKLKTLGKITATTTIHVKIKYASKELNHWRKY